MKILVIEDNQSVRRLIRRATADFATEILEREDGADALDAYECFQPDVVFMDVKMPRMDGLRATRLLLKHHPLARIIIVTDYDDDGLRQEAKAAGACGYALKENLIELEALVEKACAK